MTGARDHVWEWCGDRCVACRLTATEIAERGHTACTAYVPDDFSGVDRDELWKSIAEASQR